jgi:hypothetical protein
MVVVIALDAAAENVAKLAGAADGIYAAVKTFLGVRLTQGPRRTRHCRAFAGHTVDGDGATSVADQIADFLFFAKLVPVTAEVFDALIGTGIADLSGWTLAAPGAIAGGRRIETKTA